MKTLYFCLSTIFLVFAFTLHAQPLEVRLNSYQKIDEALAKKEISVADAAGYRVLAFFADESLPVRFHSDPEARQTEPSDLLLQTASELLKDMQPALAAQVYGRMIPPAYAPVENEKENETFPTPSEIPSQEWAFVDDLSVETRIWYLKDNLEQHMMAHKLKKLLADHIIPEEKKLMGRTHPRDDLNNNEILVQLGISRAQPNGGDGKLDIYIYNIGGASPPKAWVQGYSAQAVAGYGCPERPSYMAFNLAWAKTASEKKIASTLAHEYFHVIQNSYNRKAACDDYTKIDEGTATYIKHHIYPKYNDEHIWWEFSENGLMSLIDESYASWPFYYFMVEMQGASVMPELHNMMGSHRAIESVNKVLNGGFKKQWLEYAVYEWNQEPLMDGFRQWDGYNIIPGRGARDATGHMPPIKIEKVELDANGQYRKDMLMQLKPLTRDFYAYDVSNADIRSIAIENPVFWAGRKVQVKALVRKKGQSKFDEILWEDTKKHEYHYCFDKKDEEIDMIVLVFGNFQHLSTGAVYNAAPAFKVTNLGCYGYKGKMNSVWDYKDSSSTHHLEVTATDYELRENGHSADNIFKNQFYPVGGKVSYTYKGSIDNCHANVSGNLILATGKQHITMGLAPYNVAPEAWGSYAISASFVDSFISVTYVCPSPKPPITSFVAAALDTGLGGEIAKHEGKAHLKGSSSGNGWSVTWDFSPVKE